MGFSKFEIMQYLCIYAIFKVKIWIPISDHDNRILRYQFMILPNQ